MGRRALHWGLFLVSGSVVWGCSSGESGFQPGATSPGPGASADTDDAEDDDPDASTTGRDDDDGPSSTGDDGDSSTGEPQCVPTCDAGSCGDDGCGGSCGTCGDGQGCDAGACVPWLEVVYVFDQTLDALVRMEDMDGDGRMDGPGEAVVFLDDTVSQTGLGNSQGIAVLGPDEVMVTDNFDPVNLVHLVDLDGDRTAFGANESSEFFAGALAGGYAFDNPSSLHLGPDGSFYFTHNNGLDQATISGIFSVSDGNGDGVADGDAQMLAQFSGPDELGSTVLDAAFDGVGSAWVIEGIGDEPNRLVRVDLSNGSTVEWMGAVDVFQATGELVIADGESTIERLDETGELVLPLLDLGFGPHLVAVGDANGNDAIEPASEMRMLVDYDDHPELANAGSPNDIAVLPDGTMIFIHRLSDTVFMARDRDDDGSYESISKVYDAAEASDVQLEQPLSVHAYSGPAPR